MITPAQIVGGLRALAKQSPDTVANGLIRAADHIEEQDETIAELKHYEALAAKREARLARAGEDLRALEASLATARAVADVTPCTCSAQRERAERAEAALATERARVARVEALVERFRGSTNPALYASRAIAAALADPDNDKEQGR